MCYGGSPMEELVVIGATTQHLMDGLVSLFWNFGRTVLVEHYDSSMEEMAVGTMQSCNLGMTLVASFDCGMAQVRSSGSWGCAPGSGLPPNRNCSAPAPARPIRKSSNHSSSGRWKSSPDLVRRRARTQPVSPHSTK